MGFPTCFATFMYVRKCTSSLPPRVRTGLSKGPSRYSDEQQTPTPPTDRPIPASNRHHRLLVCRSPSENHVVDMNRNSPTEKNAGVGGLVSQTKCRRPTHKKRHLAEEVLAIALCSKTAATDINHGASWRLPLES